MSASCNVCGAAPPEECSTFRHAEAWQAEIDRRELAGLGLPPEVVGATKAVMSRPPLVARPDLVPAAGIMAASRAMGAGAAKYGGIVQRRSVEEHYAALLRHLLKWRLGEDKDPDSGLSHLDHAAARMMLLIFEHDDVR